MLRCAYVVGGEYMSVLRCAYVVGGEYMSVLDVRMWLVVSI